VQRAVEGHEGDAAARAEVVVVQLEVASDLLLVVVDLLLAELVAGVLQLCDCQVIYRVHVVLHILIILGIEEDHDAWEDESEQNEGHLDGVEDGVLHILVHARVVPIALQIGHHRVVEISYVGAPARDGAEFTICVRLYGSLAIFFDALDDLLVVVLQVSPILVYIIDIAVVICAESLAREEVVFNYELLLE